MTPFVVSLVKQLRQCRTETDYYRLQIEIQKLAPPRDVEMLVEISVLWPQVIRDLLVKLDEHMRIGLPRVQQYRCGLNSEHYTLYVGREADRKKKKLMIIFAGVTGFPFVPVPIMLQHFPDDEFDVLLLRDPTQVAFAAGLRNHSGSFTEMMRMLSEEFDFASYSELRAMGISGGGAAAIASPVVANVTVAAAFCGRVPTTSARYGDLAAPAKLEELVRKAAGRPVKFIFAHGADSPQDARNTADLAAVVSAPVIAVPGVSDHNLFWPLHQVGELNPFLRRVGLI